MTGPCAPWADEADLCAPCATYETEFPDIAEWLDVASLVMWNLTGQRYGGICDDAVRPCSPRRGCHDGCSCPGLPSLRLPGSPVEEASIGVTLDGVDLPQSVAGSLGWRLDDEIDLVFVVPDGSSGHGPRGRRSWPCCQDMRMPATAEGTWLVEYAWGLEPPAGAAKVTATLACQLALSCDPDAVAEGRCLLPEATTQVTRQGITVSLSSAQDLFVKGFTGLKSVDLWLAAERAGRQQKPGRGWRPGNRRSVRRFT